jgi:hypothetical protein
VPSNLYGGICIRATAIFFLGDAIVRTSGWTYALGRSRCLYRASLCFLHLPHFPCPRRMDASPCLRPPLAHRNHPLQLPRACGDLALYRARGTACAWRPSSCSRRQRQVDSIATYAAPDLLLQHLDKNIYKIRQKPLKHLQQMSKSLTTYV